MLDTPKFYQRAAYLITLTTAILLGCSNNETANADHNVDKSTTTTTSDTSTTATTTSAVESDATVVSAVQKNLTASGIDAHILSATPTDMPDIYWVSGENMPSFFTDKTGQHIIQGQIVRIGAAEPIDITAKLQSTAAQQKLATVAKEDMVIFPANGDTKGVIYAFTDADCGYCRKLHSEMKQINDLGIEVRYLAWPRSQETLPKMEAIWCSEDRNTAMNTAKSGGNVTAASCENPVEDQVALGLSLGVRGTPAVFTQSGEQIGGYLPAQQIAEALGIK
ncbi:DsbC family protein [Psychrobacter sp. I-STPA10]|uniref:DsbC family protein n=1 Tax=Psychrobacter sp. I-STPA10 TaxID=2585769 RepID=UPI001E4E93DE|nr:DsbC family protein [Psychrobacter sp. I-STPA10]